MLSIEVEAVDVQMETCGDDNEPHDIEDEVGNNEGNPTKTITLLTVGEIIGGEKKDYMTALQCPTGLVSC